MSIIGHWEYDHGEAELHWEDGVDEVQAYRPVLGAAAREPLADLGAGGPRHEVGRHRRLRGLPHGRPHFFHVGGHANVSHFWDEQK